jgi:RND family efflux transporter MFP subunit
VTHPTSNSTPPPPGLVRATLVAIVVILVAVVAGLIPRLRQRAELAAETRELALHTVSVVSPQLGSIAIGPPLPAEVKPWIEAPIYARASGYLKRWLTDIGARVDAGQLLAEIDTPELNQQLERARHELAQVEAALALARITADRYTELVKTASVSEQETAEKQADVKLKTASAAAARAEVRRLEELKSFARVTAPFAGVVTLRNTDVGDLITAGGSRELFRLAQTDKLRVFVHVPQAQAMTIAPGQTADLLIPERPDRVFTARVARTAGAISADSRTLLTELEMDNEEGEILAGSFAQVRLSGATPPETLTLPGNVLLFRGEGPQVGVVQPDGHVELRPVKLGRDFGATIEVVSGVSTKDRVILNPPDSLASGTMVRVAAASLPEKSK